MKKFIFFFALAVMELVFYGQNGYIYAVGNLNGENSSEEEPLINLRGLKVFESGEFTVTLTSGKVCTGKVFKYKAIKGITNFISQYPFATPIVDALVKAEGYTEKKQIENIRTQLEFKSKRLPNSDWIKEGRAISGYAVQKPFKNLTSPINVFIVYRDIAKPDIIFYAVGTVSPSPATENNSFVLSSYWEFNQRIEGCFDF